MWLTKKQKEILDIRRVEIEKPSNSHQRFHLYMSLSAYDLKIMKEALLAHQEKHGMAGSGIGAWLNNCLAIEEIKV